MPSWVTEDLDELADSLGALLVASDDGTPLAGWHFIEVDPDELNRNRSRQRMYLARYGRQDYFVWESKDVQELDEAFEVLVEMIKQENELSREAEDRG